MEKVPQPDKPIAINETLHSYNIILFSELNYTIIKF